MLNNRKVKIIRTAWDQDIGYYKLPLFTISPEFNYYWSIFSTLQSEAELVLEILDGDLVYWGSDLKQVTYRYVTNCTFTDNDVTTINKAYFWMLDHPEVKEMEIHGINFIV